MKTPDFNNPLNNGGNAQNTINLGGCDELETVKVRGLSVTRLAKDHKDTHLVSIEQAEADGEQFLKATLVPMTEDEKAAAEKLKADPFDGTGKGYVFVRQSNGRLVLMRKAAGYSFRTLLGQGEDQRVWLLDNQDDKAEGGWLPVSKAKV